MIGIPGKVRIYLACGVTDMRRGFDSLAAQVQTMLNLDPHDGALYAFRGRRGHPATFCIRFSSRDGRVPLASALRADFAGLAVPSRQGFDLHLY